MKVLYWLSWIPVVPFLALSGVFLGIALLFDFIGNYLHDQTTYRAWSVLHKRECDKMFSK